MVRPIYSFDDHHIGPLSDTGQTLREKVIPRPTGLTNTEWYRHAGALVSHINSLPLAED